MNYREHLKRTALPSFCLLLTAGCAAPRPQINPDKPAGTAAEYKKVMGLLRSTIAEIDYRVCAMEDIFALVEYKTGLDVRVNWLALADPDLDLARDARIGSEPPAEAESAESPRELPPNASLADVLDAMIRDTADGDVLPWGYEVAQGALLVSRRDDLPIRPKGVRTTEFNDLGAAAEAKRRAKCALRPTPDPKSPDGVYIPRDLDDCLAELRKMLSPTLIEEMKSGSEDDMSQYYFSLGMWMRNYWGLWNQSQLCRYFEGLGVTHPDSMSGIILDSFWRHLHGKAIDLEGQVASQKVPE